MDRALLKKIAIAAVVIVIIAGLYIKGFFEYFTFEELMNDRAYLRSYVAQYPIRARCMFIALYIMEVLLFIPAGAILGMLGGFLFGMFEGTFLINIAATAGATITFIVMRYYVGKRFQAKYTDRLGTFNQEIAKHGTWYLLIGRLIPVLPFFIVNVGAALTPIHLMQFIWTTSIGIIPITAMYTYIGSELNLVNDPASIFSRNMIIVYIVLAGLIVAPIFIKWWRERKAKANI